MRRLVMPCWQDFQITNLRYMRCLYPFSSLICLLGNKFVFISFQRKVRREGSTIIPKRLENWTTFLEIFIIKFLVASVLLLLFFLSCHTIVISSWNSTHDCGLFYSSKSSGIYSLYTSHICMHVRLSARFRARSKTKWLEFV